MKPPKVVNTLEDPTEFIEVRLASFLSSQYTTMTEINPPERKLAKRTSVHCSPKVSFKKS